MADLLIQKQDLFLDEPGNKIEAAPFNEMVRRSVFDLTATHAEIREYFNKLCLLDEYVLGNLVRSMHSSVSHMASKIEQARLLNSSFNVTDVYSWDLYDNNSDKTLSKASSDYASLEANDIQIDEFGLLTLEDGAIVPDYDTAIELDYKFVSMSLNDSNDVTSNYRNNTTDADGLPFYFMWEAAKRSNNDLEIVYKIPLSSASTCNAVGFTSLSNTKSTLTQVRFLNTNSDIIGDSGPLKIPVYHRYEYRHEEAVNSVSFIELYFKVTGKHTAMTLISGENADFQATVKAFQANPVLYQQYISPLPQQSQQPRPYRIAHMGIEDIKVLNYTYSDDPHRIFIGSYKTVTNPHYLELKCRCNNIITSPDDAVVNYDSKTFIEPYLLIKWAGNIHLVPMPLYDLGELYTQPLQWNTGSRIAYITYAWNVDIGLLIYGDGNLLTEDVDYTVDAEDRTVTFDAGEASVVRWAVYEPVFANSLVPCSANGVVVNIVEEEFPAQASGAIINTTEGHISFPLRVAPDQTISPQCSRILDDVEVTDSSVSFVNTNGSHCIRFANYDATDPWYTNATYTIEYVWLAIDDGRPGGDNTYWYYTHDNKLLFYRQEADSSEEYNIAPVLLTYYTQRNFSCDQMVLSWVEYAD